MARVDLPASKVRARRHRRWGVFSALIIICLLALFGGLVWLSHASFLRITAVQVSGTQTLSDTEVQATVQNQLAGSYWHLFAKNNIFLYPKATITNTLVTSMPVIASAEVRTVDFHTIGVFLIERQPKALWCPDTDKIVQTGSAATSTLADTATSTPPEKDTSGCLLLDQNGVAYAPAGFAAGGGAYKRYYGAITGSALPEQYLAPGAFSSLSALVDALAQNQSQDAITSVEVDSNNDVHVGFVSGFMLLFPLSADGGDVYNRFMLALQSDVFAGHTIADFQYLDLRFGDKLYYKLKATSQ
ncbi:MAG TPA: hypothetical protein VMR46_03080 [Candidatus Paceibacterota bacterium]|nr:hypothetical protein [Candidatus Paceibacterota bacterium]